MQKLLVRILSAMLQSQHFAQEYKIYVHIHKLLYCPMKKDHLRLTMFVAKIFIVSLIRLRFTQQTVS